MAEPAFAFFGPLPHQINITTAVHQNGLAVFCALCSSPVLEDLFICRALYIKVWVCGEKSQPCSLGFHRKKQDRLRVESYRQHTVGRRRLVLDNYMQDVKRTRDTVSKATQQQL